MSRRNPIPFSQHSPLFLPCGNCKLANFSMGSLGLDPDFLGKDKAVVIFFLAASLFLLSSSPGFALRGDRLFPRIRLDFLLFCWPHSLLGELTFFGNPSPPCSSSGAGFGASLLSLPSGGAGSGGGTAEEEFPGLAPRSPPAPLRHSKAADIPKVKLPGSAR